MTARLKTYGGLLVPPAVWSLNVELGLILPPVDCRLSASWTLAVSAIALVAALAATGLSGRDLIAAESRMHLFLAGLSLLVGMAFTYAILLQGAAAWLLHPCL